MLSRRGAGGGAGERKPSSSRWIDGEGGKVQSEMKTEELITQNLRDALEKHRILIEHGKQELACQQKSGSSLCNDEAMVLATSSSPSRSRKSPTTQTTAAGKTATILVSKSKTKSGLPLLLKTPPAAAAN